MMALRRRLDAAAESGRTIPFWWRDDDAEKPSAALDRLLRVAGSVVPLTLAVIPAGAGEPLAARLEGLSQVSVAVHGWSHANHAPFWQKPQELGAHRRPAIVAAELARGQDKLRRLFPLQFVPLLVPPWNRIAPEVIRALHGFAAVSVYGAEAAGPMPFVNVHVDIIDWRGSRGGRDEAVLEAEIISQIGAGGSIGVMTHHLVHDSAAWRFLERLFENTVGHPAVRWVSVRDLIGSSTASTPP